MSNKDRLYFLVLQLLKIGNVANLEQDSDSIDARETEPAGVRVCTYVLAGVITSPTKNPTGPPPICIEYVAEAEHFSWLIVTSVFLQPLLPPIQVQRLIE
jgi:hypothetical protein